MRQEVLTKEQAELLPLVKKFIKDFGLVGGTAIALQIGHRRSIDFDLFSDREFNNAKIRRLIITSGHQIGKVYKDEAGQFTFFVNPVKSVSLVSGLKSPTATNLLSPTSSTALFNRVNKVQFTFFHYSFKIEFSKHFEKILRMPDLLTLAAMKAYALGRRAKWKDYVDLYFIINKYHSIKKIVEKSKAIFKNEFNERIFREQLAYFKDIDYREEIDYLPGFAISDKKVKKELIKFSLE
ncbi:MAG: nucleotidyl transferase AbiEii/AbiGii toxin family protein [Candidatus Falkowbacteria bacterium]